MALGGGHTESFWLPGSVAAVVAHLGRVAEGRGRGEATVLGEQRVDLGHGQVGR